MSDLASTDRFRLLVLLTLGLVAALGSYWLLAVLREGPNLVNGTEKQNEPDYFIDNFHMVKVSANGQPHYIMAGKHLVHRPLTDMSDIDTARMLTFNPEQAPLSVSANHAQLDHRSNTAELSGQVLVVRAPQGEAQGWQMQTEALTMLPDNDQLHTAKPVQITSGKSILQGVGMFVDNAKGVFQLKQQAVGHFPPPESNPPKKAAGKG